MIKIILQLNPPFFIVEDIWPNDYPECALVRQSPIDISSSLIVENASLRIDFTKYDTLISDFDVTNTGHTIQFEYVGKEKARPTISGSALNGHTYSLTQLHFHWGQNDGRGSEHTINGTSYDLEVNIKKIQFFN